MKLLVIENFGKFLSRFERIIVHFIIDDHDYYYCYYSFFYWKWHINEIRTLKV